jgi:hypothetical protein
MWFLALWLIGVASAADLKLLHGMLRVGDRNFKSKAALESWILPVPFAFRSS